MMSSSQIPREGNSLTQWAMLEFERLLDVANFLWDDLDHLQLQTDFDAQLEAYKDTCDAIDLLVAHPECVFEGHSWAACETELDGRIEHFSRCSRCPAELWY